MIRLRQITAGVRLEIKRCWAVAVKSPVSEAGRLLLLPESAAAHEGALVKRGRRRPIEPQLDSGHRARDRYSLPKVLDAGQELDPFAHFGHAKLLQHCHVQVEQDVAVNVVLLERIDIVSAFVNRQELQDLAFAPCLEVLRQSQVRRWPKQWRRGRARVVYRHRSGRE